MNEAQGGSPPEVEQNRALSGLSPDL
jgi:hypothetical protein